MLGTTVLGAIKETVGEEIEINYKQNPSTDTLERNDISFAIVAVGEATYAESVGDNLELVIPFNGPYVIRSVTDKFPTLVILIFRRPLLLEPWLLEKIDALVAAWLPGTEAQGITDVIFGDYNFKGQLPMTWFRRVEDLDQPSNGVKSHDPLFPFGFGLTYAKD